MITNREIANFAGEWRLADQVVEKDSAAYVLEEAGAAVPLIVVDARWINPDWRTDVTEWWKRQLAIPFSSST